MNPKQILIVGIRLLVIVWMVNALGGLSAAVVSSQDGNYLAQAYPLYLAYAGCWLLLWCFPATIVKRLLPDYALADKPQTPYGLTHWIAAGVALIGLFVLQSTFGEIAYWVTYFYLAAAELGSRYSVWQMLDTQNKSLVVLTAVQIIIGVLLIARAGTLARYLVRRIDA